MKQQGLPVSMTQIVWGLVPLFTLQELGAVLRDLRYGKAADAICMVAEMFKYSNIPLQTCLLDIYNSMIASGSFVNAAEIWR